MRLRLKHKNRASGDGGGKVQVGPIVSTRVRIINVDPFPSGHLIIDDGSRSLGAKMEDTFGLSLAQQKRRVSGIATYGPQHDWVTPQTPHLTRHIPIRRYGPQLAEFVDLHESDDARFFYFSKQQRAKLGLVWSFFLEVNRPHWVASSKYLLAKLYSALYSMFLLPWLSKTLIDSVVGTLRWDTALWVSMVAATAYAWGAPRTWRRIMRTAPYGSSAPAPPATPGTWSSTGWTSASPKRGTCASASSCPWRASSSRCRSATARAARMSTRGTASRSWKRPRR